MGTGAFGQFLYLFSHNHFMIFYYGSSDIQVIIPNQYTQIKYIGLDPILRGVNQKASESVV